MTFPQSLPQCSANAMRRCDGEKVLSRSVFSPPAPFQSSPDGCRDRILRQIEFRYTNHRDFCPSLCRCSFLCRLHPDWKIETVNLFKISVQKMSKISLSSTEEDDHLGFSDSVCWSNKSIHKSKNRERV